MAKVKNITPAETSNVNPQDANVNGTEQLNGNSANDTASEGTNSAPAPEPTSPKLDQLNVDYDNAFVAFQQSKPRTEEARKAGLEVMRLEREIAAEKQAILKAIKEQQIADQRNARVQIGRNFEDALRAELDYYHNTYKGISEPTADDMAVMNEFTAKSKTAFETLSNELLGKYASSTTTPRTPGEGGEVRGEKSKLILARFKELYEGGKTPTEARKILIHDEGFNDGTVGSVVKKYLDEIGANK